jgi:hypothetical protein
MFNKTKTTNKILMYFSDYLMEYSTHVFIQQTPITEQNFELK